VIRVVSDQTAAATSSSLSNDDDDDDDDFDREKEEGVYMVFLFFSIGDKHWKE
jgi:hypothetical protein